MRFENLEQWLEWQTSLHPSNIELGLDRIDSVWSRLGSPKIADTVVTVSGTNGKGSCVAFLESIYQSAGYQTGAYTSPHLFHYTERLRIDGLEVEALRFCDAFEKVDRARGEISLTYFEFGTLAVLLIMSELNLQLALLEVGLGGRLDAVNIIDADVALVSSIAIDHTDWLGDTREQIGFEKAGIFRKNKPAICADPQPPASLIKTAEDKSSELLIFGTDFIIRENDRLSWDWIRQSGKFYRDVYSLPFPGLRGKIQLRNAAAAIAVIDKLSDKHPCSITNIRDGLSSAKMPGRFESGYGRQLPDNISLIYDVAHNPESAETLADNLRAYPVSGKSIAIFSVLNDKDVAGIVDALRDCFDSWYLFPLENDRAMKLETMANEVGARKLHKPVKECSDIVSACQQASGLAVCGDQIVIFGSFFTVADAKQVFNRQ